MYIKRVINRANWKVEFTDPLINLFPFHFNSKLNKLKIRGNDYLDSQITN